MSWIEKVDSGITITTGDGKRYSPLWKNPKKSVEYNISQFNFDNVQGTLVERGEPMGRKFPLELYFQGENHLDEAFEFEQSAKDKRAWVISHPFYDEIYVQPIGLEFDNTSDNVSKITGTVIETISDVYPRSNIEPLDKIEADFEDVNDALADDFASDVPQPNTAVKDELADTVDEQYANGVKDITVTSVAEDFKQKLGEAQAGINNLTAAPLAGIRKVQNLITAPARFQTSVKNRLNLLKSNFDNLVTSIDNLLTPDNKKVFQNNAGAVIAAMVFTVIDPQDDDYQKRSDIVDVIDTVNSTFSEFTSKLDELQTDNGGEENGFVPSPASLFKLTSMVNFTMTKLFTIIEGAAQERTVVLTQASDPINLTHRFYGLDALDENLQRFIDQNEIGINELFEIPAGKSVIYTV